MDNFFDNMLKEAQDKEKAYAESKNLSKTVYDYLAKDYPKINLTWVKDGNWFLDELKLDDIKMGRRPGGARETDKTKAIQEKYEKGEELDPVVVVHDGKGEYRLADGYHRTLAKKKAGHKTIKAYVMRTNKEEGPWLEEMHRNKLSKGVKHIGDAITKKAEYQREEGIEKEAKVRKAFDGFKDVLKGTKRDELKGIHETQKTLLENANAGYKKAKKTRSKELKGNAKEHVKEMKRDERSAFKDYSREANKTLAARLGVAGTGATGLAGGTKLTKNIIDGDRDKEMEKEAFAPLLANAAKFGGKVWNSSPVKKTRNFTGHLTGSTARKSKERLNTARQQLDATKAMGGKGNPLYNANKDAYSSAKRDHRWNKIKRAGARTAVGGTAAIGIGTSQVNKALESGQDFEQQRKELEEQRKQLEQNNF